MKNCRLINDTQNHEVDSGKEEDAQEAGETNVSAREFKHATS